MTVQETYQTQITWLRGGDPALRYQTLKDLWGAPEPETSAIRDRIFSTQAEAKLCESLPM